MSVTTFKSLKQLNCLVVFIDEKKKIIGNWSDPVIKDYLKTPIEEDFGASFKESLLVYTDSHPVAKRLLLIGTGPTKDLSLQKIRILAAEAARYLKMRKIQTKVGVLVPKIGKIKSNEFVEAFEIGAGVFQFNMTELRSKAAQEKEKQNSKEIRFEYVVQDQKETKAAQSSLSRGRIIAEGVNFGRRLVTLSPLQLKPVDLAKAAEQVAKTSPSKSKIKCNVWTETELKKNKYGGILAVGMGSDAPPRMVVLQYKNAAASKKPVTLVGKGVTFDAGGLSLKPPPAMETMKYDMAGAASVLAAFKIVTDLQLKLNLNVVIPTVENMPSGKAQRPGDVITMANGKTVEVLNTDAEGRLILADALYHATEVLDSKAVVNAATLTGACAAVVGDAAAGYFGTDEKVKKALVNAAEESGEHLWPLPDFDDFYGDELKSEVADLRNIGRSRKAGATTAGMFLREFIQNDVPWVHLDIAGCGWYDAPRDFINIRGASGVPIRLLVQFIENFS